MVTVIDYAERQRQDGSVFYALILQGGLSLVQSRNTGNFYATVKKCSIPITFDEKIAQSMVGEQVPGSIQRKSCEPYEWTNKETGELLELSHRWVYLPEGATIDEAIVDGHPEVELAEKKEKKFVPQTA